MRGLGAGLLVVAVALVAAGCGGNGGETAASGDGGGGEVALVAYSTPQEVYGKDLIPAFQKTPEGEGVNITTSFAGSGDSRRAVEAGQPADFVHLPLEPDMAILAEENLIPADYREDEFGGSPQSSVVVFVTRPGNPAGVKDWPDLL